MEDTKSPGDQTLEFVRRQEVDDQTDSSIIMANNTSQFLNDTTVDADNFTKTELETRDLEQSMPISVKTKKS